MKYYPTILILGTLLVILSGCIEDSSMDSLINDLDHENESIRNAAMESLSGIGDDDTVSSLMQVTNNNSNTVEKRKNAIKVLGTIGNDHASELLLNISLDEKEEKTVRMSSILALGEIGNETMLMPLGNLSYADDGLILYHAAYVLDQIEENKEDVYASYGKLPYPLSEEQRVYRNNLSELHEIVDKNLPVIENATTMFSGYNIKSGYIEIASDIEPESSEMNEIYKIYDTEARKIGINQVPVRFVQCESISLLEYWYNVSDFDISITYVYTWSDDDDDVKSQIFIP
ncbi:HEAT repeat domain-containing protein [Methanolobus vulcani]|uniref:HEAT repeat domain-containing protein n=1 Tax=Methanolobus vulcani TaxID=38026 RepID=A0A7Z8P121_9EURY|nr:HEAT repeat domain-containing protein [Methanolobus vulcani]TQD23454.1 HEAT repeat domain-containing protein [Methanolobus vulcani]